MNLVNHKIGLHCCWAYLQQRDTQKVDIGQSSKLTCAVHVHVTTLSGTCFLLTNLLKEILWHKRPHCILARGNEIIGEIMLGIAIVIVDVDVSQWLYWSGALLS
jgi:hypothetical protein